MFSWLFYEPKVKAVFDLLGVFPFGVVQGEVVSGGLLEGFWGVGELLGRSQSEANTDQG